MTSSWSGTQPCNHYETKRSNVTIICIFHGIRYVIFRIQQNQIGKITARLSLTCHAIRRLHDDVIKWKHFPRNWPFVRAIHRSPVNCPHKGRWRGALMFSLICVWINNWVNNRWWFETLSWSLWRHCNADSLKQKCHFDLIFITGCTTCCQNVNFRCN